MAIYKGDFTSKITICPKFNHHIMNSNPGYSKIGLNIDIKETGPFFANIKIKCFPASRGERGQLNQIFETRLSLADNETIFLIMNFVQGHCDRYYNQDSKSAISTEIRPIGAEFCVKT